MEKYLDFVTIDFWEIIFTWVNLLILFLLMKKILFKPIKNILEQRENEVNSMYSDAENAKNSAESMEKEYTRKLADAKNEANEIVKNATRTAELRSEEIIRTAQEQATNIKEKANKDIERDKINAINEAKKDISEIAVSIAEKVIEKDINEKDYDRLIENFINEMGDSE
ncbi:MAG: F0F1 ATP synthase subunit B [Clostridia bacterium]|nr:F0F1 ATP synthase subunit B [Clostridia bacterium]